MTQDEEIEFERLKTARDALLLTVANLRGQLETIAAEEREACAKIADELVGQDLEHNFSALIAINIRARGQA
jgi:hypothetical protein